VRDRRLLRVAGFGVTRPRLTAAVRRLRCRRSCSRCHHDALAEGAPSVGGGRGRAAAWRARAPAATRLPEPSPPLGTPSRPRGRDRNALRCGPAGAQASALGASTAGHAHAPLRPTDRPPAPAIPGCYLVCFSAPFHGANGRHIGARHYVGYSDNIAQRLLTHRAGQGSPLLAAALEAGLDWRLVRVWPGADRTVERRLHNRHDSRLCPQAACRAIQQARRAQLRLPLVAGASHTRPAACGLGIWWGGPAFYGRTLRMARTRG
jgi:hypothetical protein